MEINDAELSRLFFGKPDNDRTEQEKEDCAKYFSFINNNHCKNIEQYLITLCELFNDCVTPHNKMMYKNLIKGFLNTYASLNECESFSEESLKYFESKLKDD